MTSLLNIDKSLTVYTNILDVICEDMTPLFFFNSAMSHLRIAFCLIAKTNYVLIFILPI